MKKRLYLVPAVAVAALVAAAPVAARHESSNSTTVKVTLSEMKIVLSKASVPKGAVVFQVVNKGALSHDFKLAGKKTPMLKKGQSAKLTVTFSKRGSYAYLCTVAGHAAAGMKGKLTVK